MKNKLVLLKSSFDRRLPFHPKHLLELDELTKNYIAVEHDYGEHFLVYDDSFKDNQIEVINREELRSSEYRHFIILKPTSDDLLFLPDNSMILGWIHLGLQPKLIDICTKKDITLVGLEYLNIFNNKIDFLKANSFIAGYVSVYDAFGYHGVKLDLINKLHNLKAIVFGYGNVAKGSIKALQELGITSYVITKQSLNGISKLNKTIRMFQIVKTSQGFKLNNTVSSGEELKLPEDLTKFDFIINASLNNEDFPILYQKDFHLLKQNCLIVEVSFAFKNSYIVFDENILKNLKDYQMVDNVFLYAKSNVPDILFKIATTKLSVGFHTIIKDVINFCFHKKSIDYLDSSVVFTNRIVNRSLNLYR